MTTVTTNHLLPDTAAADPRPSRAVAVRRWFIVASPVLAGLFAIVGAYADPAAGTDGVKMWTVYAQNQDALQFKSLGFHWSYAFWIAPALLLVGYVRGKGAWLANIAAVLGFVGMTTLPGLLFVDWLGHRPSARLPVWTRPRRSTST